MDENTKKEIEEMVRSILKEGLDTSKKTTTTVITNDQLHTEITKCVQNVLQKKQDDEERQAAIIAKAIKQAQAEQQEAIDAAAIPTQSEWEKSNGIVSAQQFAMQKQPFHEKHPIATAIGIAGGATLLMEGIKTGFKLLSKGVIGGVFNDDLDI